MSDVRYVYTKEATDKLVEGLGMDGGVQALSKDRDYLADMGIQFSTAFLSHGGEFKEGGNAMDAANTQPVTTPSNGTPLQYLQTILPGSVRILTTVRKADEIAPVAIVGKWHDQQVVVRTMEHTSNPQLYSDHGGLPLVSFNETYEDRQIVRFENGIQTTLLADAVAAATGTKPNAQKQGALTVGFETLRNDIGFYGFNIGNGRTYGILNDPNLPNYVTLANGAGGDNVWSSKTVAEIISDFTTMFDALAVQSGGNIDVINDKIKVTIPLGTQSQLYKTDSSFSNGKTVMDWLGENHKGTYIVVAPQFVGADSGENAVYMQADSIMDSGDDDGQVMFQAVQSKLMGLGSAPNAKGGVEEGYSMATAGCWVKRPYGVVRYSGC